MSWFWAIARAAIPLVLGLFGFAPKKNQSDIDRAAGEELGRAKQNAQVAEKELDDAKISVEASRAAGAADDAGELRQPHAGDRAWNPDGIG